MTATETITEDGEVIDVSGDMNALAVLSKAEIDQQISTAKKYPRSLAQAKRRMIEMACLDEVTAKSCGYALKRTDKDGKIAWIEGPSVRMAEIAVSCWGNIRYGARVISEDDRFVTAQGVCHDLEVNVFAAMEVRRRITNRSGRKYSDDMVGVTGNAACGIAARNAVFKVIPRAIINAAYSEAMKTASGDTRTFAQRRQNAITEFVKLGVTLEEVMTVLGKPRAGLDDVDTTDLRRLHGLLTSINDGESTVDQIFRPKNDKPTSEATEKLNERLGAAAKAPETKQPNAPTELQAEGPAGGKVTTPAGPDIPPVSNVAEAAGESSPAADPIAAEVAERELAEALSGEWGHAVGLMLDAAERSGMARGDAAKAIENHVKIRLGRRGKEDQITPDARRVLYDACAESRISLNGTIAPKA